MSVVSFVADRRGDRGPVEDPFLDREQLARRKADQHDVDEALGDDLAHLVAIVRE